MSHILIISDLHIPYHHPDSLAFLTEVKRTIKPDKIISVGDEVDLHAFSYHEKDPDLASPGHELKLAIEKLQCFYKLFPEMDLLESNHGSLVYRKSKTMGLPRHVVKSYGDILEAPKGWAWRKSLTIVSGGEKVFITHGMNKSSLKNCQEIGMNFVQGHHHSTFDIQYWASQSKLYWGMTVGCLIDDESFAFAYNKMSLKRPVIGCGAIINGEPMLIPMKCDERGRWVKNLSW